QAVETMVTQHFAGDLAVAEPKLATLRARRRVHAQLVDGELPLREKSQHLGADQPRRAHHTDTHRYSLSRPNAAWRARTARSTSSSPTTQEMRMVDVLIISMLTPSAASTSNIFAAMPGCVFIPAPTRDTRPMC